MKAISIHFFSPSENSQSESKPKKEPKLAKVVLTGYISSVGKLVLPAKTVANLGVDLDNIAFKVGMTQGKWKATSLYLVPTSGHEETFSFEKAAKSYTLTIPFILRKSRVDFSKAKYGFAIRLFDYEGTTAFELQLTPESTEAKAPYAGKPRGRKPGKDVMARWVR